MAITRTKTGIFKPLEPGLGQDPDLCAWGRLWNFPLNFATLHAEHPPILDACATFLKEHSDHYCRIIGLASRSGSNAFNKEVSDKRARNVSGYLSVHGKIALEQMTHQSGSLFLSLGEEAWAILGVKDVKSGDTKNEKDRHRTVVLEVWKHHNPTLTQQMSVLRRLLLNDAQL